MENHLYECLHDILRSNTPENEKFPALQRYKAKIVQLQAEQQAHVLLDTADEDSLEEKEPSLYHVIKVLRRREIRATHQVQDVRGNTITRPNEVIYTIVTHPRQKFSPLFINLVFI
jgi:hypothetical protein